MTRATARSALCEFVRHELSAQDRSLPIHLDQGLVQPCPHVIHLNNDASWLFETTVQAERNSLYARSCFYALLEQIMAINAPRIAIVGSPGSGKTFFQSFLVYQLRRLVSKDAPCIILDLDPTVFGESYMVDGNGEVYQGIHGEVSFEREKRWASTFYLYEAKRDSRGRLIKPPVGPTFAGRMIVFCVPDMLAELQQELGQRYRFQIEVLPPWKWYEVKQCRDTCYPHLHNDTLQMLFELWGGNARRIFDVKEEQTQAAQHNRHLMHFDDTFQYVNLDDLARVELMGVHALINEENLRKRWWLQLLVHITKDWDGSIRWVCCSEYAKQRLQRSDNKHTTTTKSGANGPKQNGKTRLISTFR